VGIRAILLDGSYHEVDSSEMAFKIAASMAFKEAAGRAAPKLLEPVMSLEVVTPEVSLGDVIADLNGRRGKIHATDQRAGARIVKGAVPLACMFGYATDLRSRTQGRATFAMQFSHYQTMPDRMASEVVARAV
jgi:elongation factor G